MKEIRLKAYAKINLGLDVLKKRPDGYHELRMIMQTVSLHDRIYIRRTKTPGIRIWTNLSFLPTDENNLVYRAAKLLMEEFAPGEGVFIDLEKHIPVAAGLAGGSADAAAVLVGINRLFDLQLSQTQLMVRGKTLGADVPYCILRGTALAEGIGEILTPLSPPPPCKVVLAKPGVHVSTKYVYGNLKADEIVNHPDIDGQIAALMAGDLAGLCSRMGNVLERVTITAAPAVTQIEELMKKGGAINAMMSGSGPTVFGLFAREKQAREVYGQLRESDLARQVYLVDFYTPGKNGRTYDNRDYTADE